ncbi:hypothetical protein HOM83_02295, partial [Candidatus Falkowbacteria bacterium]|nr:hypothetical protein [Candidatus Falkowbacteria bacterium]
RRGSGGQATGAECLSIEASAKIDKSAGGIFLTWVGTKVVNWGRL